MLDSQGNNLLHETARLGQLLRGLAIHLVRLGFGSLQSEAVADDTADAGVRTSS